MIHGESDGREDEEMRWRLFLVISMISLLFLSYSRGTDEVEPNDSMDFPQTLMQGTVNGTVNTTGDGDTDIFKIDVPPDNVVFFSLKKADIGSGSIGMDIFDSGRQKLFKGNDLEWEDRELTISGETNRGYLASMNDRRSYFLAVTGKGSYELEVLFNDTDDADDPPGIGGIPLEIGYDEQRSGRVFEMEYGYLRYTDVDIFEIPLEQDGYIEVRIRKTDNGTGTIHAGLDQNKNKKVREVDLSEKGQRKTLEEYFSYYEEDETVFLMVWGEGEYEIDVSTGDDYPGDEFFMAMMGAMMCFYMMILLVPLISFAAVIIIIIFFVVKGNKDKDRVARRRKGAKYPGRLGKVPRRPPK
jgi:hypothetical protein